MKIANNVVVGLEYTLKGDDGTVIDSSVGGQPLYYLHGHNNIVIGLESALEGKEAGDTFEVSVAPEEGYGTRNENLVVEVPKDQLPADFVPQKGKTLSMNTPQGAIPTTVVKVKLKTVVLDGNHELADKTLHFSGSIKELRKPSKEELAHGHVHAPGHHHH